MIYAIIVITHLWHTDFQNWWNLYFDPANKSWYEGQVWGNVFAVLPLGILGAIGAAIGFWVHKLVTKEHEDLDAKLERQHNEHSQHLKDILDALDPKTDGGIADIHTKLDEIKNELNPQTEGGLKLLLDRIEQLDKLSTSKQQT
jgi:hypothetical protein